MQLIRALTLDWDAIPPDSYLRGIPALRHLTRLSFDAPVTFFTGENGSGKSTLLEAIAVAFGFNAEGGNLNYRFSTYDSHSELASALRLIRNPVSARHGYFLRAESFYNVASAAEEYRQNDPASKELFYRRYGGKAFHEESHGESFFALMKGEFRAGGLYLLDEPEAALSPQRQLAVLHLMKQLGSVGAQFIVASHSPILLGTPGAARLNFTEDGVASIAYEETESYRVTELFINHRERLLKAMEEE